MNLFGGVIPVTGITFLMFSIFAIIAVTQAIILTIFFFTF